VPAAIANAIYNATGARLRSVPFTPDKVQAALKQIWLASLPRWPRSMHVFEPHTSQRP